MKTSKSLDRFASFVFDYENFRLKNGILLHADCFEWLSRLPENSLHAIVTDPPYGVKEYEFDQIEKRENGNGGIWRLPPSFDGHKRAPLPRFTALNNKERAGVKEFFFEWAKVALHAMRPGAHLFLATNSFLSQLVFSSLIEGGFEFRGEIIRLVTTLRGGDRPKNAEQEFPDVASLPRANYEPWGLLRKPLPRGMKVSDCLREFETGGVRRTYEGRGFGDVILCSRTSPKEKKFAKHPTVKPQAFMRRIVWASLPLGTGIIADPFMGSGSTVAAAEALDLNCIGIERYRDYFDMSKESVPHLATIHLPKAVEQEETLLFPL